MRQQHLAVLAIFITSTTIRNAVVCSTVSPSSPLFFLDSGDIDDFMKLLQRYQTSSQLLFPSKEYDQGRMDEVLRNVALAVGLAVIYMDTRNKYINPDI